MKKIRTIYMIVLTVLLILSMTACKTDSDNPNSKVIKELEKTLGKIENLPISIDMAIEQVGQNAVKYQLANENSKDTSLAIIDDAVLYCTTRTVNDITESDVEFSYTITMFHIGKILSSNSDLMDVQFVAAHMQMSITSNDVESAKNYLKDLSSSAPIDDGTKKLYYDLIDGKQIYITSDSALWDEFDLEGDVTVSLDPENKTFEFKFTAEVGTLYHETTRDAEDRILKNIAYYYDEEGNKWIEYIEENTYTDEGTLQKMTYYFPNSDQIRSYSEGLSNNYVEGNEIVFSYKPILEQEYYEDGTLKSEYCDHSTSGGEENYYKATYYPDGQKESETYFNEAGARITYQYLADGSVCYYEKCIGEITVENEYIDEDGFRIVSVYFESGNLYFSKVYNSSGILIKEEECYESFRIHFIKEYFEDTGALRTLHEYYDDDNSTRKEFWDYSGVWYLKKSTYYPSGQKSTESTWYTADTLASVNEWYENGNQSKYCEYDIDGNVTESREYFENGMDKHKYYTDPHGNLKEYEFYANGQASVTHVWFADGAERIEEYYEDGAQKYWYYQAPEGPDYYVEEIFYNEKGLPVSSYFINSEGNTSTTEYEYEFYDNGQLKYQYCWSTSGWDQTIEYYDNGQIKAIRMHYADGIVDEHFYDEYGNEIFP